VVKHTGLLVASLLAFHPKDSLKRMEAAVTIMAMMRTIA
jgi:hypothetical protein